LINGLPYGWFHERRLKDQVFAPDWHSSERVSYTLRLVEILRQLLPDELDGGVSTCPLSYKPWFAHSSADWNLLIQNVVSVAEGMFQVRREHGRLIHLDIEPEPDGLVENTLEFLEFFKQLLSKGAPLLAQSAGLTLSGAEEALREHVGLCLDLCHFAVEHEDTSSTVAAVRAAGVRIGRVQVSSALKVSIPPGVPEREVLHNTLTSFIDPVYLHQVIGTTERFQDLPEGLACLPKTTASEWRVHYHVPLFIQDYETLSSTQPEVKNALAQLTPADVRHLEIETYTWGVLPAELKVDLVDSIEREYRWVLANT
jgi:hypothetical protein